MKAMPPLPANHKALLACQCLCLNLQRIQGVQQQVVRIRNPIRIKDNRHVLQPCCAGCFPLTCQAVRRENSSREDAVNNHQSSSASLAHIQHLQVVKACTPARSCHFRVACSPDTTHHGWQTTLRHVLCRGHCASVWVLQKHLDSRSACLRPHPLLCGRPLHQLGQVDLQCELHNCLDSTLSESTQTSSVQKQNGERRHSLLGIRNINNSPSDDTLGVHPVLFTLLQGEDN